MPLCFVCTMISAGNTACKTVDEIACEIAGGIAGEIAVVTVAAKKSSAPLTSFRAPYSTISLD